MKAKQLLALFLAILTVMTLLVSCGGDPVETEAGPQGGGNTDAPVSGGTTEDPGDVEITDDLGDVNFADVTNPKITFFVRTGYEGEIYAEEIIDEDLNDAIYWRNQEIQNRLGVEIAHIAQEGSWGTGNTSYVDWNATLRNAVQTTTHDFDATLFYTGTASSLATEGCYLDLTELDMISLEKPWWNQNLMKEATIYGALYFAGGSIAYSQVQSALVFYYNKDLYNEYFATAGKKDIYQVVRDGEWTIDYLHELTAAVWDDADGNGEVSSGDIVGWGGGSGGAAGGMDSWVYALGCDLTKIDESIGEPVACFYDEHTVQAYEKLVKLYTENEGAFVNNVQTKDVGETTFSNGKVLTHLSTLQAGSGYNEATFRYGVLPVPKFDADQEKYRSIPEVTSSMVAMLSTLEPERTDMVAATIELTAAEAYKQVKPAYVEIVLKSQNASSPEDAEMVDLILDSMVYSFGWIFSSTHMGNMGKAFRVVDGTRDITQYYESNKSNYEAMIDLLIDGYAGIV